MVDAQKLIDYINETGNLGVDATSISMHFGIWRNDAVVLLDSLIAEGRLTKKGSKPILYFLPSTYSVSANSLSTEEDTVPFSNMIGYNGSLAMQTQMALAASSYPPHGIHTLIEGETGVGKTLLACEMARNLKSIKAKNNEEAPFVMFNCAEYANNPQLLLSQLFGYAKGSFTGAVKDKAGLIEEANGGVLFLDEIHRLPPTGQEMLFAVIDKGIFRRMGDTTDRFARFMLIGATTEDPAESLLSTFKRRMPLTIEIPSLSERPINERLDIISLFFDREANNLCLPIRVSCAALRLLISCKGKNNIGDLRNEIQLACARAYLKHIQDGSSTVDGLELEVDVYALSRRLAIDYSADEKVDAYFSSIGIAESVCYVPEKKVKDREEMVHAPSLTGLFDNQFKSLSIASQSPREIVKVILRYCIIPYLDLMLALACGQLVLSSSPIDSTVSEILTACKEYFGISFENCMPISTNRNSEKTACSPGEDVRNVIITYCITGIGSARAVRELLLKNLSIVATTDIIPLGIMDDISTISKDLGERLKLIIGITNPQIPGVPFINMEQVFSYTSIEGVLQANGIHIPTEKDLAIDPEDSVEALPASARLDYCYSCLDYFSPSLPKEKVDATVKNMIKSIEQMYVSPMSPDFLVRVYIHCCTMFERMHTAKPIPMPLDADVTICQNLDWYTRLQEIMLDACKAMAIEYEKSEAYYLMMALPTDDLIYHKVEKGEG